MLRAWEAHGRLAWHWTVRRQRLRALRPVRRRPRRPTVPVRRLRLLRGRHLGLRGAGVGVARARAGAGHRVRRGVLLLRRGLRVLVDGAEQGGEVGRAGGRLLRAAGARRTLRALLLHGAEQLLQRWPVERGDEVGEVGLTAGGGGRRDLRRLLLLLRGLRRGVARCSELLRRLLWLAGEDGGLSDFRLVGDFGRDIGVEILVFYPLH